MKMFKKFTQMALVAGLLVGGLAINVPTADAKVVASGKTTAYFSSDGKQPGMKYHTYSWDQKKVGKDTYHTVNFKSPFKSSKRQYTKVMMFKIDSKGVQKQVRTYTFKKDGKEAENMSFTVKSKTSSKGTYFYYMTTSLPFETDNSFSSMTKKVVVK